MARDLTIGTRVPDKEVSAALVGTWGVSLWDDKMSMRGRGGWREGSVWMDGCEWLVGGEWERRLVGCGDGGVGDD